MRHRASRQEMYCQVRKDTKQICEERKFTPNECLAEELDISKNLLYTIKDMGMEFARSSGEVKEALELAETKEEYYLCIQHWIGRLLLSGESLGYHTYFGVGILEIVVNRDGMKVRLAGKAVDSYGTIIIEGKVSKVVGKIFGEKFTTYMCQHYPVSIPKYELHFSRHYLPELYRHIAKDENCTSCMSKESSAYDLPDTHHPVMAYEDSPNAALALLWNSGKGRYVARAIVNLDEMEFSTAYGVAGATSCFEKVGLCQDSNMDGLLLSKKEYEGELLLPYIDGYSQTVDRDYSCEYMRVDECGDIEGDIGTGRENCRTRYCEECCSSHSIDDRDFYYVEGVGEVCDCCLEDYYCLVDDEWEHRDNCFYCEYNEEWYLDSRDTSLEICTIRGSCFLINSECLGEALDHWDIDTVDGTPLNEYLGIEEEEAA